MKATRNTEIAQKYRAGTLKADLGREYALSHRSVNHILQQQGLGRPAAVADREARPEPWLEARLAPYADPVVRAWVARKFRAWQEKER